MEPLERYRPLIDDFEAFLDACERPLSSAVRVNTIKADVDRVQAAFDEAGVGYEPADWNERVLTLDTDSPGTTWPSMHGWIHGQEEVSALPPVVLDPKPDERVWDAAAAPGSKTTQLAALMDDRGLLVANDNNLGRLSALRLWSLDHVSSVAGVQKGILTRAIQATRPGGTIVYSTCTFAPEENEAVLDHVLETEDCRVVEQDVPMDHAPGVTEWDDESYDPSVEKAARIYPHHNDTGGFFCATLEVST